jgi:hypothetical protein
MERQATRFGAQRLIPSPPVGQACTIELAAAVPPDLSADRRWRASKVAGDPPNRPASRNTTRNLFALLKPQRRYSPAARYRRNAAIESKYPVDPALVSPSKRTGDVRYTLTALPALPQLSLLSRREPYPGRTLHALTSSSRKIRRCCADPLNSPR